MAEGTGNFAPKMFACGAAAYIPCGRKDKSPGAARPPPPPRGRHAHLFGPIPLFFGGGGGGLERAQEQCLAKKICPCATFPGQHSRAFSSQRPFIRMDVRICPESDSHLHDQRGNTGPEFYPTERLLGPWGSWSGVGVVLGGRGARRQLGQRLASVASSANWHHRGARACSRGGLAGFLLFFSLPQKASLRRHV
jgi:hypothetical protein